MKPTGVITFLWTLTIVGASPRSAPTPTTWISSLSSDASSAQAEKPSVMRTFELDPTNNISSVIHFNGTKAPSQGIIHDTANIQVCLNPRDAPVSEDCESLCDNMSRTQGPLIVQPFEIWHYEAGHCIYGLLNLDPCRAISIDPISMLAQFCWSMYHECVVDGYDGYIERDGVAMAMSGTEAAPPYPSPREC
ncbi:hypothetical protein F4805DRAFT_284806 [Annulohypoxylon moriforme]|nr:hypothetical protein F4805DRAFT_284806 [Annulohypoxylon moriforme]